MPAHPIVTSVPASAPASAGGLKQVDLASLNVAPAHAAPAAHAPVHVPAGASDAVKSGLAAIAALQKASDAKHQAAVTSLRSAFQALQAALNHREAALVAELHAAHQKEAADLKHRQVSQRCCAHVLRWHSLLVVWKKLSSGTTLAAQKTVECKFPPPVMGNVVTAVSWILLFILLSTCAFPTDFPGHSSLMHVNRLPSSPTLSK